jgi:uncharacterized membrane protein YozB (DUF420 family)
MIDQLPFIDACLNACAFVLMCAAILAVKARKVTLHRWLMAAAITASAVFLGCYLTYHFSADPKPYLGTVPWLFYPVLVTHVVLAIAVPFLVGYMVYHGTWGNLAKHRRMSKIAFPIWAYVSVTGVLVYWFVHT